MTSPAEHPTPKPQEPQACRSCGACIFWLKSLATGKVAPVDAEPSPNGNITANLEDATYAIVPANQRAALAGTLRTNHFSSCPQARSWKSGKGGRQ
ncbi:MAG TPA: hypothetical protein VGR57_04565 [Ktedonobacterales bacterium]|nr:hypothetical protein [Ktedonobacterales bacterium]